MIRSLHTSNTTGQSNSQLESDSVIELDSIAKSFSRFQAIRDVSLKLPTGVIGLLGPNGAGKSTLIKILLGLLRATSGTGKVLGMDVWKQSRDIRQRVGYMPEDDCYMSSLSGVECVQFAARLNCIPQIEALRRAHEILDYCGAGQERYRNVETYSTGMRQKLKFAQALVHDPQLLILDEPTAGLDPDERDAMLARIHNLSRNHGKSIVVCTHILPDVQQVSDFVVILAGGKVSVAKPMAELAKPAVPTISVRTLGPSEVLQQSLNASGISSSKKFDNSLIVEGDSNDLIRTIWRSAEEQGVIIKSLSPSQNSMETIFLEAVIATTQQISPELGESRANL